MKTLRGLRFELQSSANVCQAIRNPSTDTDLYSFLSNDQVTSIQAAFPRGNPCSVKFDANDPAKKSSVKIKLKAEKNTDSCSSLVPPS